MSITVERIDQAIEEALNPKTDTPRKYWIPVSGEFFANKVKRQAKLYICLFEQTAQELNDKLRLTNTHIPDKPVSRTLEELFEIAVVTEFSHIRVMETGMEFPVPEKL